jgi:hypothetical protein
MRAKNIKNKPRVNDDPKDTMLSHFQACRCADCPQSHNHACVRA